MYYLLILLIILIIYLKYVNNKSISKKLDLVEKFSKEDEFQLECKDSIGKSIKTFKRPSYGDDILSIVSSYNRHDVPIYIKNEIYTTLNKYLFKNSLNKPIEIDYIKIKTMPGFKEYYLEVFVLNAFDYTTNKYVIIYNIYLGSRFELVQFRKYSHKETRQPVVSANYTPDTADGEGDSNIIISRKNLTNPFFDNSANPTVSKSSYDTTTLEYSQVPKSKLNIFEVNSMADKSYVPLTVKEFNNTIYPVNIPENKNIYMTMTPEFLNNNLYPVEIVNDIFERTRDITSYPHARSR